jgi:hypothetical protein
MSVLVLGCVCVCTRAGALVYFVLAASIDYVCEHNLFPFLHSYTLCICWVIFSSYVVGHAF